MNAALPDSIGNLQNLTRLDVQGNALQGNCRVVPSRTSCPSSSVLTHISALPESIGQLSSLETLHVSGNAMITGRIYFQCFCSTSCPRSNVLMHIPALPDSIGQLSSLQSLNCYGCNVTGRCLGQLVVQAQVYLHDSQPFQTRSGSSPVSRSSIATRIASLVRAPSRTSTTTNTHSVLPESIGQMQSLTTLWLNANAIAGKSIFSVFVVPVVLGRVY
jgi:Leucine-rich repeat (LRR) protein